MRGAGFVILTVAITTLAAFSWVTSAGLLISSAAFF